MSIEQALFLAIVQGLTEFLPISSSAHLIIISNVFGYENQSFGYDILLHGATLLAVVLYFLKDIRMFIGVCFKQGCLINRLYLYALMLGTVPLVIVGLFFFNHFESLRSIPITATALIISAFFLAIIDYVATKGILRFDPPLISKGIGVGVFQTLAIIPGVSRSGITIAAGRLFGFSRQEAIRFSFLLSIPAIAGALIYALITSSNITILFSVPVVLGMLVAFSIAYIVIYSFIHLVDRFGFLPFFIYQMILGIGLLLL